MSDRPLTSTEAQRIPPPSVHARALKTWLAIFPLVTLGSTLLELVDDGWHPVFRCAVLTALVVPAVVYTVVPWLLHAQTAALQRMSPSTS